MKIRPIIFSGPMVRALLDGSKTQTRRVLKPQPLLSFVVPVDHKPGWFGDEEGEYIFDARYATGDLLYVRENLDVLASGPMAGDGRNVDFLYAADGEDADWHRVTWPNDKLPKGGGSPSIHMPRVASRLTLQVTAVRVERVQEISNDDAEAEGIESDLWDQAVAYRDYSGDGKWFCTWPVGLNHSVAECEPDDIQRRSFRSLWDSINFTRGFGWEANPWVVAVTFKVHRINVDKKIAAAKDKASAA